MEKYLKLIRVKQWIKNGIVFAPLIFSGSFRDCYDVINSLVIFFVFCFVSSGVYIFNDVCDLNSDKEHPIKKKRPLASGEVSILHAKLLAFAFYAAGLAGAYYADIRCLFAVVLYMALNYFYTKYLKFIPVIDVICISSGFILRVLAGCFAIFVEPSVYILFATLFISLFFGFYKRLLEINLSSDNTRGVLLRYTKGSLEKFIVITSVLFIAFYTFYTVETSKMFQSIADIYLYSSTVPLVYIIFRLIYLLNCKISNDDPSELFYSDRHIRVSLIIYGILVVCFVLQAR